MIDGKVWELNNAIGHFEAMDYIMVKGKVTNFQGNNQLNIEMIRKADEGEYQISDYMPSFCCKKCTSRIHRRPAGALCQCG